jgi:hypothetical protein
VCWGLLNRSPCCVASNGRNLSSCDGPRASASFHHWNGDHFARLGNSSSACCWRGGSEICYRMAARDLEEHGREGVGVNGTAEAWAATCGDSRSIRSREVRQLLAQIRLMPATPLAPRIGWAGSPSWFREQVRRICIDYVPKDPPLRCVSRGGLEG